MPREVKNWAKREVWISHLFIFANIKSKFSEKSDFEARPQSTPSRERDIRNLRCKLHIISSNQLYRILPYPLNRLNVTFKSVKTAKSCTSWRGGKLWIGYLESKRFFKYFCHFKIQKIWTRKKITTFGLELRGHATYIQNIPNSRFKCSIKPVQSPLDLFWEWHFEI